jgi:hypothetical protein
LNLYGYIGGDPINGWDPYGLASWSDHWEALGTWTLDEFEESRNLGFMATADGIIPFKDPFKESGKYSGCEDGAQFSHAMGGIARDAALAATGAKIYQLVGKGVLASSGITGTSAFQQGLVGRAGISALFGRQAFVETFGRAGAGLHLLTNLGIGALASAAGIGVLERIEEITDLIDSSQKECK